MCIPFAISYMHFFFSNSPVITYTRTKNVKHYCMLSVHRCCPYLLAPRQRYAGLWQMEVQLSGDHSELFL